MKFPLKIFLIFLFTQLFSANLIAGEFAISPMLIDIDGKPGSKQNFSFQVHGKKAGKVRVYFSHMHQQATGHMDFADLTTRDSEFVSWISLDKQSFDVAQGETISVMGEIEIPKRSTGSRLLAIMVEEDKVDKDSGININVRYAIILNMNVDGRRVRPTGTFSDLIVEEQNGHQYISGWFENTSDIDATLDSVVYLRDANRRLVDKVQLKTKSAWQRGDSSSIVYPSGKVKVYGLIEKELTSGDYQLTARNRFGGKMQRNVESLVAVTVETAIDEQVLSANDAQVRITPNPVKLKSQTNGNGFGMVRIVNPMDQPVTISFPVEHETMGKNFRFTPEKIELLAGASSVVTLRQQNTPEDAQEILYRASIEGANNQQWLDIKATF